MSTSLTDPYFPFVRCDGKVISKALLDTYAYPDPDDHIDEPVTVEDVHKTNSRSNTGYNKVQDEDNTAVDSDVTGYQKLDHQRQPSNSDLINGCSEAKEDDVHQWATTESKSFKPSVGGNELEKDGLELSKIPILKPSGNSRDSNLTIL